MIVVTGAYGIVGRAFCKALTDSDISYLAVGRICPDWADGLSVDLTDEAAVDYFSRDVRLQCEELRIVHLAAAVPHKSRYANEIISAELTRKIDYAIFNLAKALNASVIYLSSCGLYDREDPSFKHPDQAALVPTSPYFDAKLEGEALFSSLNPMATCLRLSAPIGPGIPQSLVLPRFVSQARDTGAVQVWGTGRREQDFIDVRDAARLLMLAAQRPVPGTFNLARGIPTSMRELANNIIQAIGQGEVVLSGKADPSETHTARYSIDKTYETFGWVPTISLSESISTLLDNRKQSQ